MRKDIFIHYAQEDEVWAQKIKKNLFPLKEELQIDIWDDSDILPGENKIKKREGFLQNTKIVIVLLSADYLASSKTNRELEILLNLSSSEKIILLPVFVKPFYLDEGHPLFLFQPLNPSYDSLVDMGESRLGNFNIYLGNRIKIALVDIYQDIKNTLTQNSEKKELRISIQEVEHNIDHLEKSISNDKKEFRQDLSFYLAIICIVSILKRVSPTEYPNGLRIKDLHSISKTEKRKFIFQALDAMENWDYVQKTRLNKETFWKITKEGLDFSEKIDRSFLFDGFVGNIED